MGLFGRGPILFSCAKGPVGGAVGRERTSFGSGGEDSLGS